MESGQTIEAENHQEFLDLITLTIVMQLEMYLNGKFIDSVPVSNSQLTRVHELQLQLERRYCHSLEYSDNEPQFFISGIPSGMDERERNKLKQGLL